MAKEVITRLIDDLDGSDAVETVHFGLDGKSFSIDLSKKNASALRKTLKPYIEAGTAERSARRTASTRPKRQDPDRVQSIRAWARKNGYEISDRGRIPRDIQEAFDATK